VPVFALPSSFWLLAALGDFVQVFHLVRLLSALLGGLLFGLLIWILEALDLWEA
jgi:hypothetical protein